MSEPTAYARITEAQWGTLREMFKQADVTKEGVELRRIFDQPFQEAPLVIVRATELIQPWADIQSHVGRDASPVTIQITGPARSGKTMIANAIEASLRVVNIQPRMVRVDADRKRKMTHGRSFPADPVVIIEDRQ